MPNAKPDFKQRLVIRERWESISELNIYMRLLPFPPWADPPPVDRALGSALADPLEAEDPPLAGKTPGIYRPEKIEIEKAHKGAVSWAKAS